MPDIGCNRRSFLSALGVSAALAAGCSRGPQFAGVPRYLDDEPGGPLPPGRPDVLIYGATPGGIVAAVAAAETGSSVMLLEPSGHVGGMMTGGLSAGDVADRRAIGGLVDRTFRLIGEAYGLPRTFSYEPHVARRVFEDMLRAARIQTSFGQRLVGVRSSGGRIETVVTVHGEVGATNFIDASYEGDLLALAGAPTRLGREGREAFGETWAGVTTPEPGRVRVPSAAMAVAPPSPYSTTSSALGEVGTGDTAVQAYGFRLCLVRRPSPIPWPAPPDYRREDFTLVEEVARYGWNPLTFLAPLPNGRLDLNSTGILGADLVTGTNNWTTSTYNARAGIWDQHLNWLVGMLHFLSTDSQVPSRIRDNAGSLALAPGEFTATGGWPAELYVRESRRLVGQATVTEHDALGRTRVSEPIALASYKIDSHPCRRVDAGGSLATEGDLDVPVAKPWGIPLGTTLPAAGPRNLATATTISASHVAWCSARMEPTFMAVGEAVGTGAALAATRGMDIADLPYNTLRDALAIRRAAFTVPTI